ncbi:MAG: hypothetical protein ACR2LQ_04955 [Acidimicrobiales bacterium]
MELIRWCRLQWDRVLGALGMVLGVVLLLVGWLRVSATEFVAAQIPYVVSAGIGGLVAIMIGGTLWLSADLRDEWRQMDGVEDALERGDRDLDDLRDRIEALETRSGDAPDDANPPVPTTGNGARRRSVLKAQGRS